LSGFFEFWNLLKNGIWQESLWEKV
jgi:hypothetical protein